MRAGDTVSAVRWYMKRTRPWRRVKRLLCLLGVHDWQPQSFVSGSPKTRHTGTGRECSRCGKYVLLTWNHDSADWP